MSTLPVAVLFDIDGTLITTGGAGAAAWGRAFADLYELSLIHISEPTRPY